MTKPVFRTTVGDREIVTTVDEIIHVGDDPYEAIEAIYQEMRDVSAANLHQYRVEKAESELRARRTESAGPLTDIRRLRIAFASSPHYRGSPFVVYVNDSQSGVDHSAVVMTQDGNRVRAFLVFRGDPEFRFVPATVALNAERGEPI